MKTKFSIQASVTSKTRVKFEYFIKNENKQHLNSSIIHFGPGETRARCPYKHSQNATLFPLSDCRKEFLPRQSKGQGEHKTFQVTCFLHKNTSRSCLCEVKLHVLLLKMYKVNNCDRQKCRCAHSFHRQKRQKAKLSSSNILCNFRCLDHVLGNL